MGAAAAAGRPTAALPGAAALFAGDRDGSIALATALVGAAAEKLTRLGVAVGTGSGGRGVPMATDMAALLERSGIVH